MNAEQLVFARKAPQKRYLDSVIPDRRAAKINVKVGVGIGRTDKTIFLNLGLGYEVCLAARTH